MLEINLFKLALILWIITQGFFCRLVKQLNKNILLKKLEFQWVIINLMKQCKKFQNKWKENLKIKAHNFQTKNRL